MDPFSSLTATVALALKVTIKFDGGTSAISPTVGARCRCLVPAILQGGSPSSRSMRMIVKAEEQDGHKTHDVDRFGPQDEKPYVLYASLVLCLWLERLGSVLRGSLPPLMYAGWQGYKGRVKI